MACPMSIRGVDKRPAKKRAGVFSHGRGSPANTGALQRAHGQLGVGVNANLPGDGQGLAHYLLGAHLGVA